MDQGILGVDIGGVIISRADEDSDTSFFGDNYLATPSTPRVFDALARLAAQRFGDRIHVVSKCGRAVEAKSLAWLAAHRFHERTGVPADNVHFCRERADKGPIAADLGLTHFVDDRLEVLGYLTTVEHRYLFQPLPDEVERHRHQLERVHRAESWDALVPMILAT